MSFAEIDDELSLCRMQSSSKYIDMIMIAADLEGLRKVSIKFEKDLMIESVDPALTVGLSSFDGTYDKQMRQVGKGGYIIESI